MLTLNVTGKSGSESVALVQSVLKPDEDEAKILIDGIAQAESLTKFLKSQGFNDVVLEDDDGLLYVTASKKEKKPEQKPEPVAATAPVQPKEKTQPATSGILISSEARKNKAAFLHRFIASLLNASPKPEVIALMNSAVRLAAYSSPSCSHLKALEAQGIVILVSQSCADNMGISEAIGAGIMCQMSEILGKVFSCEKVVSI